MDLRQIQYFICLYEEQSVTRAAKRLNIVQPALSMQITRLEAEVGQALFTRTPRGMLATPAADEMYNLFLPILAAFSAAKSKVVHDGKSLTGHVRLGLIASIGHSVLASVLTRFNVEHPKVTLAVTEGLTESLCERVTQGHLDLAFVNQPHTHPSLAKEFVMREEIVVASSPNHGIELPHQVGLKDVLAHPLILPTRNHGARCLLDQYARRHGATFMPTLELDSIMAQALMISQGPYLGFFGQSIIQNLIDRMGLKLRTHRLAATPPYREVVYVYDSQRRPTAAARALAMCLAQSLRDGLHHGEDSRQAMLSPRVLASDLVNQITLAS